MLAENMTREVRERIRDGLYGGFDRDFWTTLRD